jgi:hypothetical protein
MHLDLRLGLTQGHSDARSIKSMKNLNDPKRNQTCNLQACSAVPQSTAPPSTPLVEGKTTK